MRLIIDAEPEDAESVVRLMVSSREMFERSRGPGWGWNLRADNGKTYFVRQTKTGLSAKP
jgi:hypothetical protein